MEAGQVQNSDFRQHRLDASVEPLGRYHFGSEVLELTVLFPAFTPGHFCQTGSGSEPPTIGIVLLFCTVVDVERNLAIKYAPKLLVSDNTTVLFVYSVWLGQEDRVQEAFRRNKESVVRAWLQGEDLLADRARVQTILAPQAIQKLEVGKVKWKFGTGIDFRSTLWRRESGGENRIKAQQSSRVIFVFDELGMQNTKCFKICVVSCFEHCELFTQSLASYHRRMANTPLGLLVDAYHSS